MKYIKTILLANILVILGAFALTLPALAATTATFLPVDNTATVGQNFKVVISVDPRESVDYAERVTVTFPADKLSVNSFTFGNNWMPLVQPGYDSTDNVNGVLVKTAGYPGGVSSATVFGTISFYAKAAGAGTIKIGDSSIAFEIDDQSAIVGGQAAVSISNPAAVPLTGTVVTPVVQTQTGSTTEVTPQTVNPEQVSQSAAVAEGASSTTMSGNIWLWTIIIVILIVIVLAIYLFMKS